MKALWSIESEPQDVLAYFLRNADGRFLEKKARPIRKRPSAPIPKNKCMLIWDKDPDTLLQSVPTALIASPALLAQLLPRLLATPGALSPISAACRIWESDSASIFFERRPSRVTLPICSGLTGIIIAELLTRYGSDFSLSRTGLGVVARTFSYTCAQLVFAGGDEEESDVLLSKWLEAATLTSNSIDPHLPSNISYLSNFIRKQILNSSVSNQFSAIQLADCIVNWLGNSRDLFEPNNLGANIREVAINIKTLTREARLSTVERSIEYIVQTENDKNLVSLICGYFISLIDPGSTDFYDLALNIDKKDGHVAAAYGMCTGLLGGLDFLWKGSGFGVSIFNDLNQREDDSYRVFPDISMSELRVLRHQITATGFEFRTKHPSLIEVELLPDIVGSFSNGEKKAAMIEQQPMINTDIDEVLLNVERADRLASELQSSLNAIRDELTHNSSKYPKRKRRYT